MKIFNYLVVTLVVMMGLNSCSKDCNHDFIEHDYSKELVGTWSIIGPDHAEALVIKADGTMELTAIHEGEFFETKARYEVVNNRMTVAWEDGTTDEGRLNVVAGDAFSLIINEETGAGYYFVYCHEDLSDELIGSWMVQSDITSEIHTYYEDGKGDCVSYYYHLGEQYETKISGTYKLVGDILFENINMGEGDVYSYASRISYTPNGSPFGDVMTGKSMTMQEDEIQESIGTVVRVKQSLDLTSKKYNYSDCYVTNVKGNDMDIEFMGYTFNFAEMDGSGLDVMLKTLFFNLEFDADTLNYSYQFNNGKETFNAPIVVEGNKITIKMSEKESTLKDVVFYTFQNVNCNEMQLCMDKTAFVNFYTNMQAMLKEATDEQFDITNADSVKDIYKQINDAVETIKLTLVMTKTTK